ncbi:MAG: DUF6268 family outer membrane beta-barrel protein [Saprospiraceae bacterium]
MKYTLLILFIILNESLFAQLKPDFFPEDIGTPGGQIVRCFCKPGVRNKSRSKGLELAYTTRGKGTFGDEENNVERPYTDFDNWAKFEVDLKAPILNKSGFKFLMGYKYTGEFFNMSNIGVSFPETFQSLDKVTLKSSNISAIVTKPLDEKKYLAFRFRYTANGTYDGILNFDQKYAIYKAMGVFGLKKHDDFEWGFGLNFSKSFRRTNLLPFLVYNRTFINEWGLEIAFPGYVYGRYNMSSKTIFLIGTEYTSDSYRMDVTPASGGALDYALNHSEVLFLLRWEQEIVPWVWANVRAGFQMNFSTDFESKSVDTQSFMVDPSNSPFLEVGIFISPPDGAFK